MPQLPLLIGLPWQELKIKETVDHAGHLPPSVLWNQLSELDMVQVQQLPIYLNNNLLTVLRHHTVVMEVGPTKPWPGLLKTVWELLQNIHMLLKIKLVNTVQVHSNQMDKNLFQLQTCKVPSPTIQFQS